MTARIWNGKTKIEHSEMYTKTIEERDIPNYKKTEGFIKLTFLKRSDHQFTYFKLITFWDDINAVKKFAGSNFQKAISHKEDEAYVIDFPGNVMHYNVFTE